ISTFRATSTTEIYTLSLHDALPISSCTSSSRGRLIAPGMWPPRGPLRIRPVYCPSSRASTSTEAGLSPPATSFQVLLRLRFTWRSEEHTSELQSRFDLVCRLLLEKK